MALPDVIVVGGMKCGTTALHGYLAGHPEVAVSAPKELNFFFGDEPGGAGNWWRGTDWYRRRFPAGARVRAEASPGYTSPDHPEVAARIAATVPDARLIYLARDPLDRAVSQYLHHRRDGDERRPLDEALLDPGSQYLARSRHAERLRPFLEHLAPGRLAVIAHEDLRTRRRDTLRAVFAWLGLDTEHWSSDFEVEHNAAPAPHPEVPQAVRDAFLAAVREDAAAFSALLADATEGAPTGPLTMLAPAAPSPG